MSRLVDPQRFVAKGAVVDWATWARAHAATVEPIDQVEQRRATGPRTIQLRWAFDAALGYPLTPFTVWTRRPTAPKDPVDFVDTGLGIMLAETCTGVAVTLTTPAGGLVLGFSGMPLITGPSAFASAAAGQSTVWLSGPSIKVITVPAGSSVDAVVRTPFADQDDPAWQRLELVGLPSDGQAASNTDLTSPQGPFTGLESPVQAALDRYDRGAPYYGWDGQVSGVPVPAWRLADPYAMIKVFNSEMLGDFIDMCDNNAPSGQQLAQYSRQLPATATHTAEATFNPLRTVMYGGVSDPLAALILGFGTAYPWADHDSKLAFAVVSTSWATVDFMVTALFADDLGHKVERAALVLRPGPSLPPPAPASMTADSPGIQTPDQLDDPFRPVVAVSWDAASPLFPFDLGSHAFVRRAVSPATGVDLLMTPRPLDTALQPLGASRNDQLPARRALSDSTWDIDSGTTPNDLRYAVASQNVFGQWSPWSETGVQVAEPPVPTVTVTAAQLDCTAAVGPCPAATTFDLTWNWAGRSPDWITVVAQRYPQTWASDPPTGGPPAITDTYTATGEGYLLTLTFASDGSITSVTPGTGLAATAQHLTVDGQLTSNVPLGDRGTRRYRVTVAGLAFDFDAAVRFGLGLWAWGAEARWPGRVGTPGTPTVLSAADPRPPVIVSHYDDVTLASMRDTEGLHHAQLTWAPMAGAVGYQTYTCSESTFRAFHNHPEPLMSATLRERLFELQQLFGANPERRPFTRVGTDAVAGTSRQVTLPRGTKDIHMFLMIGVSAGNVESAWPDPADPQCGRRFLALAAPATVAPGAPTLEVTRGDDGGDPAVYHARLRIGAVPGGQVSRIDLHRVRVPEAAAAVDTMGPPVVSITGSSADWTATAITADGSGLDQGGVAQPLGVVVGKDPVPGSWKPVYYRAVAWGTDDPARGQYGVRSAPSTPRSVVVPPTGPPDLSAPTAVLPTSGSADARIDTTTTEPVPDTALGPHRLEAEALLTATDGTVTTVTLTPASSTLSTLPTSPPGAGASGLWRDDPAAGSTGLHLLVRRPDPDAVLSVRLRLTDPLGRITERVLDVPAGAAGTDPDIVNPVVGTVAHGWLLGFLTHAPDNAPGGPVQVQVAFRAGGLIRGRPATLTANLADLPTPPRDPGDIMASPDPAIPVFATRRVAGSRSIGIGFRTAGVVTVRLVSPDGGTAVITRTIGRLAFP